MSSFPVRLSFVDIIRCADELGTVIVKAEPGAVEKPQEFPAELIRTKDCNVLVIELQVAICNVRNFLLQSSWVKRLESLLAIKLGLIRR